LAAKFRREQGTDMLKDNSTPHRFMKIVEKREIELLLLRVRLATGIGIQE